MFFFYKFSFYILGIIVGKQLEKPSNNLFINVNLAILRGSLKYIIPAYPELSLKKAIVSYNLSHANAYSSVKKNSRTSE